MNNTDLISVIIPTYNRANLIKISVESILNQTYKNLELIIVDDGSTDNTTEVIDSINDKRIIYVKQENQGAGVARNKGIELAKGKYIAFHDSDDVWHLDKLEKQINALKQNNADVAFCKMFLFGNLRKRILPQNFKEGFLQKNTLPLGIGTPTLIGKAEVFLNNKFDTTLPRLQDFELVFRIQKNNSIYCVDEPLVDYNIQNDSISSSPEKLLTAWDHILNKHKNIKNDYPESLYFIARSFIGIAFQIKDVQKRKKAFDLIFSIDNSKKIKLIYFLHKIHFYKIRELMFKSVTIPIKSLIKIYNKFHIQLNKSKK